MNEQVDRGLTADELQAELRDLLCLAVVGDHVRWVTTGDEAAELAEWLADAVARWRALADRVATHLVTLGVAPDGRVRSLAEDIPSELGSRRLASPRRGARTGRPPSAHRGRMGPLSAVAGHRDRTLCRLLDAVCAGLERSP